MGDEWSEMGRIKNTYATMGIQGFISDIGANSLEILASE